jgi:hypothetical protein
VTGPTIGAVIAVTGLVAAGVAGHEYGTSGGTDASARMLGIGGLVMALVGITVAAAFPVQQQNGASTYFTPAH